MVVELSGGPMGPCLQTSRLICFSDRYSCREDSDDNRGSFRIFFDDHSTCYMGDPALRTVTII